MINFWYRYLLLIITLPLFVLYQNCSQPAFNTHDIKSSPSNSDSKTPIFERQENGESYNGKLSGTYAGYDRNKPCDVSDQNGQPRPNGVIEVENGIAYETRSHCENVSPKVIAKDDYLTSKYNHRIISYKNLHYQSTKEKPASSITFPRYVSHLCRGEVKASDSNDKFFLDAVIRTNKNWTRDEPAFTSQIVKAIENSSNILQSQVQTLKERPATVNTDSSGRRVITATEGEPLRMVYLSQSQVELEVELEDKVYRGLLACDHETDSENLLSASNDFTKSPWYANSGVAGPVGLTPNATQGPSGMNDAWRLFDQSGDGKSWLRYLHHATAPGGQSERTFSVYLKYESSPETLVKVQYDGGTNKIHDGWVRVTWDAAGRANISSGSQSTGSDIQDVGNGWYRVWVSVKNNGSGNTQAIPAIYPVSPSSGSSDLGVYIWGAQFESGSGPSPYQFN